MASLGYSVIGFLAFRGGFGLRTAAVVGRAIFLLGAAAGHVHQLTLAQNFALGNARVIFYTDIALPIIDLVLLWLQHRLAIKSSVPRSVSPRQLRKWMYRTTNPNKSTQRAVESCRCLVRCCLMPLTRTVRAQVAPKSGRSRNGGT
jgi:hypothetical protein